jgi:hypothetical protein
MTDVPTADPRALLSVELSRMSAAVERDVLADAAELTWLVESANEFLDCGV